MPRIKLDYVDILDGNNEKKVLEFSTNLLPKGIKRDSLFVIKVDGQSMQPLIKDRTVVVADLSQRVIEDQGIYLLYQDERMWIKQAEQELEGMKFVSINKEFSHLVYDAAEVRVVAKAVLSFNTF